MAAGVESATGGRNVGAARGRTSVGKTEHQLWFLLAQVHRRLDAAVCATYGWPDDLADEEILARLLALNLQRAAIHPHGDQSPYYETAPHKWGLPKWVTRAGPQAGFVRRRCVARGFIPGEPGE